MFCKKCGKEIDDDAVICPHCGVQTDKFAESTRSSAPSDSFGTASLICGIIGFILAWFSVVIALGVIAIILCIVAIVLSIMSRKKVGSNGRATAGLVLGIIGLIPAIIFMIACGVASCAISTAINEVYKSYY